MLRRQRRSTWTARVFGAALASGLAAAPLPARAEPPAALVDAGAASLIRAAREKIDVGDDETALRMLGEAILADPEALEAYRLRAEVSGRLADRYSPGSAFRLKQADDLEHALALGPGDPQDGAQIQQIQQIHADAVQAARQEARRRKLLPASMSLGILGGGATLASTTLLVLANTNVGNQRTVDVMNAYNGAILGVGVALLTTAITFGVVARRQYRRDQKAFDLFQPRYAGRWRPRLGAGLVLYF